jgi:hypothetical protein
MSEHAVAVAVATYRSKREASRDLDVVAIGGRRDANAQIAGVLVEKGADGQLTICAHHVPPVAVTWRRVLPGAAITAINAPLGIRLLVPLVPELDVWSGIAALVAHFWHNIPKDQLHALTDLLEARQAAVVVVALDDADDAIVRRLEASAGTMRTVRTSADFEADYTAAISDCRL